MRLTQVCFNGMIIPLIEEGATRADLKRYKAKRERQGYDVDQLSPFKVEVTSEGLVDDSCGYLVLSAEEVRP